MPSVNISWKKTFILGAISALSLFIIFKTTVNLHSFLGIIKQIDPRYFWLAFATIPPSLFLNAVRWYFVIKAAGFDVPFRQIFRIIISSGSLAVIPGRVGDFARSYPLRHKIPVHQTIGTIVLEKVIDICILLIYSSIGLLILGYHLIALGMFAISILAIPIMFLLSKLLNVEQTQSSKGLIAKIYDAIAILGRIKENKTFFGLAVTGSITNWALSMLQFYWLMMAVHASVPIAAIFAFLPLSIFVSLIPLTLAGTGTRDAAIIYFFASYTAPSQALSAGILYGLQGYWILSLLLLPFIYLFFQDLKD